MKNIALSAYLLLLPTAVLAGEAGIVASNNQAGLAYLSTKVDYTETGSGLYGTPTGILDTETGPVSGLAAFVSHMGPEYDYIHVELDRVNGSTTYTGAFIGGQFGSVVRQSSATLTDLSGRFGKGFAFGDEFMATPYAELGWHQWDRGVNYGETYNHYYLGIGVLGQYSPAPALVLAANAMLGRTVSSSIAVNGGPGFSGFSGDLGNSPLYRVGAAVDYAFTPQVHGSIALDYTHFSYGMSGVLPGTLNGQRVLIWEPDSTTNYTQVRIGIGIAF